ATVGLDGDGEDRAVAVDVDGERGVEGTVGVQAGDVRAIHVADLGERAADEDLAIGERRDRVNFAVGLRLKRAVECAVRVKPDQAGAADGRGETGAADQ